MKSIIIIALAALAASVSAQTGNCHSGAAFCKDTQTITVSGNAINVASNGGLTATFQELINGSPTTVSIVIQGCVNQGVCEPLDTYTTVANVLRSPAISKPYDYYTVTATWTGGTNVSVQVRTLITTARNGGGGSASAAAVPGPLQFLGDGSDGTFLTCTTGTCNPGTGEYWVSSLNVAAGATLTFSSTTRLPVVIRSTGTCTIAGTILLDGLAQFGGYSLGGSGGGGGGGAAAGSNGANGYGNIYTGSGGSAGGGAGVTPTGGLSPQIQHAVVSAMFPISTASSSNEWGFGGGQGGAGGSSGPAGGIGALGIVIVCQTINFTGTISARGAPGAASTGNSIGASGGGGGGGVILRSPNLTNTGTILVTGGTGGTCGAFTTCGAGGNGAPGWTYILTK